MRIVAFQDLSQKLKRKNEAEQEAKAAAEKQAASADDGLGDGTPPGDDAGVDAGDGAGGDALASSAVPPAPEVPLRERKVDKYGRAYATGRRKRSVAKVWVRAGTGRFVVNRREIERYFARSVLRMVIRQPFVVTERSARYDVVCTVRGGGLSGQAGAVRHGISGALAHYEPELRHILKRAGFLTRDSRQVERKKYGRRKARRSFQFSKR